MALDLPEGFMEIFVPYVTKLLQLEPKNALDVYKISTDYFEHKLRYNQRRKELKEYENGNVDESSTTDVASDISSLEESILDDANFIYDTLVGLHPTEWEYLQKDITGMDFTNVKATDESNVIQQFGNLIKATENLSTYVTKILKDILCDTTNKTIIKDRPEVDQPSKKSESTPGLSISNKESFDSSRKASERRKTRDGLYSVSTQTNNGIAPYEKCPVDHSQVQYMLDTIKQIKESFDCITKTLIAKGVNFEAIGADSQSPRIIQTKLSERAESHTLDQQKETKHQLKTDTQLSKSEKQTENISRATQADMTNLTSSEFGEYSKSFEKHSRVTKRTLGASQKENGAKPISEAFEVDTIEFDEKDKLNKSLKAKQTSEERKDRHSIDLRPPEIKTHLQNINKFRLKYKTNTEEAQDENTTLSRAVGRILTLDEAFGTNTISNYHVKGTDHQTAEKHDERVSEKENGITVLNCITWVRDYWTASKLSGKTEDSCKENCNKHLTDESMPGLLRCRLNYRKI